MPAPEIIQQLVQQFKENISEYKSARYNEAQLRHEFLDKFFEALGWDVYNTHGYSIDNRDVIVEDSLEIEGHSKSPDYAFKIGKERKFYVEAKKPHVNIKTDFEPAYQLRRYAWSNHLALSVLTDFEEFSLYDCRERPTPGVNPASARLLYVKFEEYPERWDEIASILSKEAVYKGSFDRYVMETKGKKGTTEVDDEFLKDIEEWRKKLALNIALRNSERDRAASDQPLDPSSRPALIQNERQLNYAVQMTIDRLIFLRICEDRGIEPEEQLLELSKKPNIYLSMVQLFRLADTKYNSGLFHFTQESGKSQAGSNTIDTFTPKLVVDDKVLKEIIRGLYYPCPYVFKEIPVEILGQVYEQFLGKVIRLTAGHQAKIEEKPEVRKAGGVYYTPKYIVDYIVANTVGKLLEGKTPEEASQLRIVDPACGSGSFLLGAFQYLLDWHEDWYGKNDPDKWAKGKNPALVITKDGWCLTTAEKKRILVNNIYGVDIDEQAVEVTKLSLLLKVLEEESGQLSLGLERRLPDLGNNIKCGNSLIGWDYFSGQLIPDEKEVERVNPFDWEKQFPEVFSRGGFDAVIGNPPYGADLVPKVTSHFIDKFTSFKATKDVYTCFIEQGFLLCRFQGLISYIVPTSWTGGPAYQDLREFLLSKQIEIILLLPFDVFSDAYIDTLIFICSDQRPDSEHKVKAYSYPKKEKIQEILNVPLNQIGQKEWDKLENKKFIINPNTIKLLSRFSSSIFLTLRDYIQIKRGVLFDKKLLKDNQTTKNYYPYFEGDVYRYILNKRGDKWVEFGEKMKERPKEITWFTEERLLLRRLVNRQQRLMASYSSETFITNKNLYSILSKGIDIRLLLGIINSKLISYLFINQVTYAVKDDFPQVTIKDFLDLPIPTDLTGNLRIVTLVEHMLELHKRTPQIPHEQESLNRDIANTDAQIDQLVYQLYGLTDEEIRIVEGKE